MQNLAGDIVLTERFEKALVYAARLHREQRRKVNRVPYISHLIGVAALVLEDGGNEDETIAALLHDAIEDQSGEITRNEIYSEFGSRVGEIVEGCTEPVCLLGQSWRAHKQQYLRQIQQADTAVQRVALADKLHNGRSLLTNLRLGGWVDGWMGGWVDGWMGGWVDRWMGGWVDGWMGGWVGKASVF